MSTRQSNAASDGKAATRGVTTTAARIRDVMLPLDEVPVIHEEATLADAAQALAQAQARLPAGRSGYRAVMVVNRRGEVLGKIGHLAFLRAVDPGHARPDDRQRLDRAGVDAQLMEAISGHLRFWQEDLELCCRRVAQEPVTEVMHPVNESFDEGMTLASAISAMVQWQTLSVPVRRGRRLVGLLRLADIYDLVSGLMIAGCGDRGEEE